MEPIISKLQEGVKYPRFERDATTIINDLVEHITKERGVYSSSIEPNPNEHKVWFNTNNNTLNIYENGKWNTISGQGGGGGSSSGAIIDNATINASTINGGTISGATISGGYINNAYINASGAYMSSINIINANIGGSILLTGTINGGFISGGSIIGATISRATISGCKINEGGNLNYGNLVLLTYTGTVTNPMLIPNGGVIGYPNKSIKISNVTISGSKIEANRIDFISGDNQCLVYPLGSYLTVSRPLADSTLFHSIDLNHGSITGLTSIRTLSYTGLTIEPYDITGTGTPIIINGRAAGVDIGADSTAHLSIEGITRLGWRQGSSYGYMMTFKINDNTINSTRDTLNITNGSITLTSGIISGNTNINLTLSGTIKGGTISGVTISGGTIKGGTISGATIDGGYLTGSITASGAIIDGATITGGNINGATLGGINVTSGSINYAYINNSTINGGLITGSITINGATISGATMSGGNIYGASIGNVTINTGSALLYAGSKILVTYTGSVTNPILMPNGGNIGYPTASLNLCGVTLTGGDFTKLKNLQ